MKLFDGWCRKEPIDCRVTSCFYNFPSSRERFAGASGSSHSLCPRQQFHIQLQRRNSRKDLASPCPYFHEGCSLADCLCFEYRDMFIVIIVPTAHRQAASFRVRLENPVGSCIHRIICRFQNCHKSLHPRELISSPLAVLQVS